MKKKFTLLSLALAASIIIVGFSILDSDDQFMACLACDGSGVVNKISCEDFIVEIRFRNTGEVKGTWSVNIAFEAESWTWSGTPKNLTLSPHHKKTLTWDGNVPENASTGSLARLVVYYADSFKPLDWWIYIIEGAELTVASSRVR